MYVCMHPRRPRGSQSGRVKRRDKSFQSWAEEPLGTSSEIQGRSVGPGEKARQKFSSKGGKAPGYRFSPDHFQTVSISSVLFVSSYTTAIDSITACLAHAPKKCTQSGIFQLDINATFQNTGGLYTRA